MLTIYFIWILGTIPPLYYQTFQQCKRLYGQCQLLGQKQQRQYMSKYGKTNPNYHVLERTDMFRLLWLYEHGGIYLDLDTVVFNWQWLQLLTCDNQTYFTEEVWDYDLKRQFRASNWFICSGKGNPQIKYLIDQVDERQVGTVLGYAGPWFLNEKKANTINTYPMIRHCYDSNKGGRRMKLQCQAQIRDVSVYFGKQCLVNDTIVFGLFGLVVAMGYSVWFYFWVKRYRVQGKEMERMGYGSVELEEVPCVQ